MEPNVRFGYGNRMAALAAQATGQWEDAATYWEKAGEGLEAEACRMIAAANRRGDAFRARVAELQRDGEPYEAALRQADREIYGPK